MNKPFPKNSRLEPWLAVGLIAAAAAITYGILLPKLGFYRDDWYMLWAGQSPTGLSAIIRLFETDRPLIGWTYALIFKFLGTNLLAWQFFGLLLKTLTGWTVLWFLRLVWPQKPLETTCAALLFVLYPGFYEQPVAATFCIDLIGLNAIFISIALTIYTVKSTRRWLQILAVLTAIILALINLGLYEATIGLEVVRWVLVWLVVRQNDSENASLELPRGFTGWMISIRSILKWLIPYLIMLAGFLYWRFFLFTSVRRATNINVLLGDYANSPLLSFFQVVISFFKDLIETIVLAWFVPFYQFTSEGRSNNFLIALAAALLVTALAAAYLFWFYRQEQDAGLFKQDVLSLLWVGLIAVLIPQAVIVLLGRNVLFSIQWDRYTTQSMLGVAVLVSGLAFAYLRGPARWSVLGGLIMLAVMTQVLSAAFYSQFWDYERGIVWQLSWRAPGFQPGTTLIVSLPEGSRLAEEYEIWGPINMAFYPGQSMQVTGQVPTSSLILDLQAKTLEKRLMRNLTIVRDYGKPLVVSLPSGSSCVHVIDGNDLALPFFEDGHVKEFAGYSNIGLIDLKAQPVKPSESLFGQEPPHSWCFYFQKIELALQSGNNSEAARLADEASLKNLNPGDTTEWMAVVEAYLRDGQVHKASATVKKLDKDTRKYICLQQTAQLGAAFPLMKQTLCGNN